MALNVQRQWRQPAVALSGINGHQRKRRNHVMALINGM